MGNGESTAACEVTAGAASATVIHHLHLLGGRRVSDDRVPTCVCVFPKAGKLLPFVLVMLS